MEKDKLIINGAEIDIKEIAELLRKNNKMVAIKTIKDATNLGLKDAKDLVEHIQNGTLNISNIAFTSSRIEERNQALPESQLDVVEILKLVEQGKKIEAVKHVCQTANIGLAEGKAIVDKLEAGNWGDLTKRSANNYSERVEVKKINNNIEIIYTDTHGNQSLVNPTDYRWAKIKKMMGQNELVQEYEKKFSKSETIDQSSSVFVEEKGANWKLIAIIIIALILAGYYLTTNFFS